MMVEVGEKKDISCRVHTKHNKICVLSSHVLRVMIMALSNELRQICCPSKSKVTKEKKFSCLPHSNKICSFYLIHFICFIIDLSSVLLSPLFFRHQWTVYLWGTQADWLLQKWICHYSWDFWTLMQWIPNSCHCSCNSNLLNCVFGFDFLRNCVVQQK